MKGESDEIPSKLRDVAVDVRDDGHATGNKSDVDGCMGRKREVSEEKVERGRRRGQIERRVVVTDCS